VRAFAAAGPAFPQLQRLGPIAWDEWDAAAGALEQALAGAADRDRRIHHLYLPVLCFCAVQIRRARQTGQTTSPRPVLVGLQAPQGAGKSTLVSHLLALLPALGYMGAGVSIDDFYLTRDQQLRLAAAHPGNRYLEHRGYPGTHDLELGRTTLSALHGAGPGDIVRVPVYDKSRHGGRGDRVDASEWREVRGPLDIVLVEGWMLGFEPVPADRIDDAHLAAANRALAGYEHWHRLLDAFIVLRALDDAFVLSWRVEAEEAMKARGVPGLSREAIEDYVRRFLPAYALWAGRAPHHLAADRTLTIAIDRDRCPIQVK
jgi:D-glycerate 3-kinase